MFDRGHKTQFIGGHREKFVRLDDLNSISSFKSDTEGMKRCGFSIEGLTSAGRSNNNTSKSFSIGMKRGSEGIKTLGRSLKTGVTRAVFPEDLKVADRKIFDPQDKSLVLLNKLLVISCTLGVSVDPLFFYLPVFDDDSSCLGLHRSLAHIATTLRTIIDAFYIIRVVLQFRTAYIAPSSRVFGRGELVIDPTQIAKRYLSRYFIIDILSVLPLPQFVVWRFLHQSSNSDVSTTKQQLLVIVFLQYIPRFLRFLPLSSELKKTAGVFAETAWAGAAYYLLLFVLASHITGAFWYLFAVQRTDTCWEEACNKNEKCKIDYLYCANQDVAGYKDWESISQGVLHSNCSAEDEKNPPFNYGIYKQAIASGIVASENFISKYFFCLWWGLQNLSTLGQGLIISTYPGEALFSIAIGIFGLLLFALLIGNMQTYLQSLTVRLEEMRVKRRDSEQWMHHRVLPQELRERVRRYDQYKWQETRGVDEEDLVQNLPKDLRRDIKRHLCLNLVRRVPLFANMDERLLDAICERLKPSLYTENTYILREGDPVDEMLFIIRGRLESVTTDGGRSGFYNRGFLKEGDFCGEELLTWALDPKSGSSLPPSTRTVKSLTEVEAFALIADEVKFITSQFRRLHSRQVQHTFRFYSQQWRTWAACFIQAAWRRYSQRKFAEVNHDGVHEEAGENESNEKNAPSFGATILASRFAANALRGVQKLRESTSPTGLVKMPKPSEPNFSADRD
ncbi:putative cyclic nucleotide-gated ion channel 9 [Cornus florida]|uniref:putative cyclic nucleotide-gated ion channel 9 n=1 Tax=Cornus florida TaxID=4283 RepID=UPI00289FFA53|nr:putative cyclic nucleotide-gated ion channel 9 [Cornus florida]XP_059644261.1 putative cyclic nucleotide-gated ion channel 9 [Cornus florida]